MPKYADMEAYMAAQDPWKAEVLAAVREIVREAAPEAKEAIKWAQPVYSTTAPVCYIKAFTRAVNFGFWWGTRLDDPDGRLQGTGEKMRHVKLKSMDDVDPEQFAAWVRQAVALNETLGDPTKG